MIGAVIIFSLLNAGIIIVDTGSYDTFMTFFMKHDGINDN